jgi:hypothetical protein
LLADRLCGHWHLPLLVLHDFDSAGIVIKDTLENDTRRYRYAHAPTVIDLGLNYGDIDGLPVEANNSLISDERLRRAGLDATAIDFLSTQRVELNAMTARQLVDFVEDKLRAHGIEKVIPEQQILATTYRMFVASDRLSDAFEETKNRIIEDESAAPIEVPADLEARIRAWLEAVPGITWHRAIRLIVDPDAPKDETNESEDDELES